MNKPVLRLCEWGSVSTRNVLDAAQREAIALASDAWKTAHGLPIPPLEFRGPAGDLLAARQYVGVVEAGGATIEIYPKLDAALLNAPAPPPGAAPGVLGNLLWLLDVTGDDRLVETGAAGLAETDTPFLEMFARLLAQRLRANLRANGGPVRRYEGQEGALRAVRGRVALAAQITRHWNRMDTIACAWDEFTPNHALNQVLRCACRWLRGRISGAQTRWLLTDCVELLDGVEDVSVPAALHLAHQIPPFDRTAERFRLVFELAVRLLSQTGHALQTGDVETFAFLIDMNKLFERYAQVVLEAAFGVPVWTQTTVGHLFPGGARGRIAQKPDFRFTDAMGTRWIGDAKYKRPASGSSPDLSPDDVRQLTVYAELDCRARAAPEPAQLLLLHPLVDSGAFAIRQTVAWNGSLFCQTPLRLAPTKNLAENFPQF